MRAGGGRLFLPGWWWWLVLVWGWWVPPLLWTPAWLSAALSSARAACLSADGDMLPSAGAAPAVTLTTPAGRRRSVDTAQTIQRQILSQSVIYGQKSQNYMDVDIYYNWKPPIFSTVHHLLTWIWLRKFSVNTGCVYSHSCATFNRWRSTSWLCLCTCRVCGLICPLKKNTDTHNDEVCAAGSQTHSVRLREASLPVCLIQPCLSYSPAAVAAAALLLGVRTVAGRGLAGLRRSSHCWKHSGLDTVAATVWTHMYTN